MVSQERHSKNLNTLISYVSERMNEPTKYSMRYLAFVDIIGFKNIVRDKDSEWIINNIYFEIGKLDTMIRNELLGTLLPQESLKAVEFVYISDSIIISIPETVEYALEILFTASLLLQNMLFNKESPILTRGAITRGNFYHNNKYQISFGPSLSEAYVLENENAIFPRIIIDKSIATKEICNGTNRLTKAFCLIDTDGFQYIDYLRFGLAMSRDIVSTCKKINTFLISSRKQYETNNRIQAKYNWLVVRFNDALQYLYKEKHPEYLTAYSIHLP